MEQPLTLAFCSHSCGRVRSTHEEVDAVFENANFNFTGEAIDGLLPYDYNNRLNIMLVFLMWREDRTRFTNNPSGVIRRAAYLAIRALLLSFYIFNGDQWFPTTLRELLLHDDLWVAIGRFEDQLFTICWDSHPDYVLTMLCRPEIQLFSGGTAVYLKSISDSAVMLTEQSSKLVPPKRIAAGLSLR